MSTAATTLIRSARFRAERETDWRALETIVTKAEKKGVGSLSFEEAENLASLYRQAMASLSVAREVSLDKALLSYLDALCARAYLAVYAPQERLGGLFSRLLVTGIPGAARRLLPVILMAFGILILGATVGYLLFLDDPTWYNTIVPRSVAQGRGLNSSSADLLAVIYDDTIPDSDALAAFASYLFSHNTRIAIFVFGLGVFICLPAAFLTFYNGMFLGAFLALHAEKGILYDLAAWLTIHGVTPAQAGCIWGKRCCSPARPGAATHCGTMPGTR